MNDENKALRRIEGNLPEIDLASLPPEKREELQRQLAEKQIELVTEVGKRIAQSKIAENDLGVFVKTIETLDHDRKMYTAKHEADTGSGTTKVTVRGGDTKFIIPILIIIGLIVLGVIAILVLR